MQKQHWEPGLLQVFRLFGWLRLLASGLAVVPYLLHRSTTAIDDASWIVMGLMIGNSLVVLAGLYWPALARWTGQAYFPILLTLATLGLIVEQQTLMTRGMVMQLNPFLYILMILVAWQYAFREVVLYTLVTALIEIGLGAVFPLPNLLPSFIPLRQADIIFYFIISRSLSFFILGYVVTRLGAAQRRQRQALAEANQKLVSYAATLEQLTVSRERVRLARELHDILAHTLSAMAVQLEAVMTVSDAIPPRARGMLEQMQASTQSGLDETRRALSALRAAPLEEFGLAAAISLLAEDFSARHALQLTLDVPDQFEGLPGEVEQTFYRVAQEALENIHRHAQATSLSLSLTRPNGRLMLVITDNGKGFSSEKAGQGRLGLRGMNERAELIGAALEIQSNPNQGARIELVWSESDDSDFDL